MPNLSSFPREHAERLEHLLPYLVRWAAEDPNGWAMQQAIAGRQAGSKPRAGSSVRRNVTDLTGGWGGERFAGNESSLRFDWSFFPFIDGASKRPSACRNHANRERPIRRGRRFQTEHYCSP